MTETPEATRHRVLVVDDDPETKMIFSSSPEGFDVTVTDDEWEAADVVAEENLVLVVCSFTLRTRGGTPFYRFLWTAQPTIKSRFVFLVGRESPPSSSKPGAVVARPLTRAALASLVAARTAS